VLKLFSLHGIDQLHKEQRGVATLHMEDYTNIGESTYLDPPDPIDLLIASTEDDNKNKSRPLDFVRAKFLEVKQENRRLRERVTDLEQTLSIVQTAQEWTVGKGMTQEQVEKMREIKALLEQGKKAREDIQRFSDTSRQSLYEKLRACKSALKREREEKREMRDRLALAFDQARAIREEHRNLVHQRDIEHQRWQDTIREMRDRHRRELRRLQGDGAVVQADQQDKLSHFGEHVIGELTALQQHLHEVREETVTNIMVEGDDLDNTARPGDMPGDMPVDDETRLGGHNSPGDDQFMPDTGSAAALAPVQRYDDDFDDEF